MNRVSVIIPMYNSEKTIERALKSVFQQTYQNYEIIIIDDGSIDKSAEIVNRIQKENPKINIQLITQKNAGVASARNSGMKNSQGDYIAFLDSDDEWVPEKLEKQIKVFQENPDIDFLGGNRDDERMGTIFQNYNQLTQIQFKTLLFRMQPSASSVMFKKNSILNDIGYFNDARRYMEDAEYWFRICKHKNCYFLPEQLVISDGGTKAYFGQRGLSSRLWEMEKGELKNFVTIYRKGNISFFLYIVCTLFSLIKFLRRILIVIFFIHNKNK